MGEQIRLAGKTSVRHTWVGERNSNFKHGRRKTPEYNSWHSAVQRCTNPRARNYLFYGGRGITMCERWRKSFLAFYTDMGPRPDGTTIDRIDVNGNYEPGNCRWATKKVQRANQRPRAA